MNRQVCIVKSCRSSSRPSRRRRTASARQRLLAAADELFYREGVHTVGIDRVIERAGVAKASLYSTFGSKEELVLAYLHGRADYQRQRVLAGHRARTRRRARASWRCSTSWPARVGEPNFRGCAFVNASAEGPPGDNRLRRACDELRQWTTRLFTGLARELGAPDPAALGRQLVLLYDGALLGASMDRDARVVHQARAMAEALLDAVPRAPRAKA